MNFDLDSIEASRGNTFNVNIGRLPDTTDGEGKTVEGAPVGFVVVGPDSPQFEAAERQLQIDRIVFAHAQISSDMSKPAAATQVAEQEAKNRETLLKHCVVGVYGFPWEGTPENIARAFKAKPNWARQCEFNIQREANFSGA